MTSVLYSIHFYEPLTLPGRKSITDIEPAGKEHSDVRVHVGADRVFITAPTNGSMTEAARVECGANGIVPASAYVTVSVPVDRCLLRYVGDSDGPPQGAVLAPTKALLDARADFASVQAALPAQPVVAESPPEQPIYAPPPTPVRRPPGARKPLVPPPSEIVLPEEKP